MSPVADKPRFSFSNVDPYSAFGAVEGMESFQALPLDEKIGVAQEFADGISNAQPRYRRKLLEDFFVNNIKTRAKAGGEGRFVPAAEKLGEYFTPVPNVDTMPAEEAINALDGWQQENDNKDRYEAKNPHIADDLSFFAKQHATQLRRKVNGKDTGWWHDKASRLMQGSTTKPLDLLGMEGASEWTKEFWHEDPKRDEMIAAQVAEGAGGLLFDMALMYATAGASSTVLGAAELGEAALAARAVGNVAVATTKAAQQARAAKIALAAANVQNLASQARITYKYGYDETFARTGDPEIARRGAWASTVEALPDTITEGILFSKFMNGKVPKSWQDKYLAAASVADKRKVMTEALSDKAIWKGAVEGGLLMGGTEVVGTVAADMAQTSATGLDFMQSAGDYAKVAAVGGILGIGFGGAAAIPNRGAIKAQAAHIEDTARKIETAIKAGKLDEAKALAEATGITDLSGFNFPTQAATTPATPAVNPLAPTPPKAEYFDFEDEASATPQRTERNAALSKLQNQEIGPEEVFSDDDSDARSLSDLAVINRRNGILPATTRAAIAQERAMSSAAAMAEYGTERADVDGQIAALTTELDNANRVLSDPSASDAQRKRAESDIAAARTSMAPLANRRDELFRTIVEEAQLPVINQRVSDLIGSKRGLMARKAFLMDAKNKPTETGTVPAGDAVRIRSEQLEAIDRKVEAINAELAGSRRRIDEIIGRRTAMETQATTGIVAREVGIAKELAGISPQEPVSRVAEPQVVEPVQGGERATQEDAGEIARVIEQVAIELEKRPDFIPSISWLQRRLRLGYTRATRLLPLVKQELVAQAQDDQAKATGPGSQKTSEGETETGANVGRLITLLRNRQDSGDTTFVAGRELIQNSADAVASQPEGLPKIIASGTERSENTFTIVDSGGGMSPQFMASKYLSMGESGKGIGDAGGLGIAKGQFLGNASAFRVRSVYTDPSTGKRFVTNLVGTGEGFMMAQAAGRVNLVPDTEISLNSELRLTYYEAENAATEDDFDGTFVWVKYDSKIGSVYDAQVAVEQAIKYLDFADYRNLLRDAGSDIALLRGLGVDINPTTIGKQEYVVLTSLSTESADIDIVVPNGAAMVASRYTAYDVLSRGLYQFNTSHYSNDPITLPAGMAVNVKPKVRGEEKNYPFSLDRKSMMPEVVTKIAHYFNEVGGKERKKELATYENAERDAPKLKSGHVLLDVAQKIPQELVNELQNNDTINLIAHTFEVIQGVISKTLNRLFPGQHFENSKFRGLLTGTASAYGVRFGGAGKASDGSIYLDPFLMFTKAENDADAATSGMPEPREVIDRWTGLVVGVALHENLHQKISEEGEGLSRELTFTAGHITLDSDVIRATIQAVLDEPFNSAQKIYDTLQNYAAQLSGYRDRESSGDFITGRTGGLRFDARPDRVEAREGGQVGTEGGREEGAGAGVQYLGAEKMSASKSRRSEKVVPEPRKHQIADGLFAHDADDAAMLDGNVLEDIHQGVLSPDDQLAAHLMSETAWRHLSEADGQAYKAIVTNFVGARDPRGPVVRRVKTTDMIPKLREWQRKSAEAFFEYSAGTPEGRFLKDDPAFATDTYRHNPSMVREAIKTKGQFDVAVKEGEAKTQAEREANDDNTRTEILSEISVLITKMNTPEFLELAITRNPGADREFVTEKLRAITGKALFDKDGKTLSEVLFMNPDALTTGELKEWQMAMDAAWQNQEFENVGALVEKAKVDYEMNTRQVDDFAGQFRKMTGKARQWFRNNLSDVFQWAERTSINPKIQAFMKLPFVNYLPARIAFLNANRDFEVFLKGQVKKHGGTAGFKNESLVRMITVSGLRQYATLTEVNGGPDRWLKTNYDNRMAAIKNMRNDPWSTLSIDNANEQDAMIRELLGGIEPGQPGSHAAFMERVNEILPDNEKAFLDEAVAYFATIKDAAKATKQFYFGERFESFEYYLPNITYLTNYDMGYKNVMDIQDAANPGNVADWTARPADQMIGGLQASHHAKTSQQGQLRERANEIPHNVVYSNNIVDALLHGGRNLLYDIHTSGARSFGAAFFRHKKLDEIFVDYGGKENHNIKEEMAARWKRLITADLVDGQLLGWWEKLLQPWLYKAQGVALSGLSQPIAQPLSVWGYIASTSNPREALQFGSALTAIYTAKKDPESRVGKVVRGLFHQLRGVIDERRPEGMSEFRTGREVDLAEGNFEKWVSAAANSLNIETEAVRTGFAYGKKADAMLERAIGAPIRFGDSLGFDAGLLFYYWKRQKARLGSTHNFSIADLDPEYLHKGDATGAVQDIERAANVTARGFKGRYFQNFEPGVRAWRSVMGSFQGHATHMAVEFQNGVSQMHTMWRQWKDGRLEIEGRKLETTSDLRSHPTWQLAERQVFGSVGQAMVFSAAGYAVKFALSQAMLGILGDVDEDELALIYAQAHAARGRGDQRGAVALEAKAREMSSKLKVEKAIEHSQQSGEALRANLGRNVFQSMFIIPAFVPPLGNVALSIGRDTWSEANFNETKAARLAQNKADSKVAKDRRDWRTLGKLDVERKKLVSTYHIDMGVTGSKDVDLGGNIGLLAEPAFDQAKLAFTERWRPQDWILSLSAAGYGQADLNKFLKAMKKIDAAESGAEETNERIEERMDRRLNPIRSFDPNTEPTVGARQQ